MLLDQFQIFFIITILSTLITIVIAFRALLYRSAPGIVPFTAMMASLALWTSSIAFGMISNTEETAIVWIMFRMVGVILCPLFWFLFALRFSNREKWLNPWVISGLSLIPMISILILFGNEHHHLFIQSYGFVQHGNYLIDETWIFGPYFWVHFTYSYALTLIGDFFILQQAVQLRHTLRRQAVALMLAAMIPLITNFIFSFHLIPSLKINYDPLGLVISGSLIGWGILFSKLFDLKPIARQILVENMVDGMIVVDQDDRIIDLNPAAQRIFNLGLENIGAPVQPVVLNQLVPDPHSYDKDTLSFTYTPAGKNASYGVDLSPIRWKDRILGKLITVRNITDQKQLESQLRNLAITDSLTGLTNHRHFYELLQVEINRARRLEHPLSVIMFDIDHFKQVNDHHGHLVGDQILRDLAQTGKMELRPYDIFARYGGEEFIILMPATNHSEALLIAERLRNKVESNLFETNVGVLRITISLGISSLNLQDSSQTFEDLIVQADEAMYHAKRSGRNKIS